jgi:AAA15 family ATPase/GTPase
MKISKIQLKNFKFFTDLTIEDIPKEAEIVLLVGPNGTGKSCIFDAFNYFAFPSKHGSIANDDDYYKKDKSKAINVLLFNDSGNPIPQPVFGAERSVNFYGRSSYRFTSKINRDSISTEVAQRVLNDQDSPPTYTELDQRLENDIEKALGEFIQAVQAQMGKTDKEIVAKVIGKLNKSLRTIFSDSNLELTRIIDPHSNPQSSKIDLEFSKNGTIFNFRNLSSGEKEVVDIIFNFHRRKDVWIKDGVYFIDEPELHLNTKIQASLLNELHRLCKEINAQLWVATHSLGFLRAAQDLKRTNKNLVAVVEFKPEFANQATIKPIAGNREDWQRIFQTALEDLTGLLAPRKIIYCEGRQDPTPNGEEQGLDADIYNAIFFEANPDVLFVSSGGKGEVVKNASLALKVLSKAFTDVELFLLTDRDEKTDAEREEFLRKDQSYRMLKRRAIENYLFDKEVLKKYCAEQSTNFDEMKYDSKVTDINTQDLKSVQQDIQSSCGVSGSIADFKRNLAKFITSDTQVYKDLSNTIF